MGLTASVATAVAATVAGVSGMRGCSSVEVDSVPATPYGAVGLPSISVTPGMWENVNYTWPVRIFIARVADGPRNAAAAYDLFDLLVAAFRLGIQEGLAASGVCETLLESVDLNRFLTVGGEDYQMLDLKVTTKVARGVTYTA